MTTETKFEVGKYYKRGDGELIRVVCVDAPGEYSVIGVRESGPTIRFTSAGQFYTDRPWMDRDLLSKPIEPKKKGVVWVNVYEEGKRCGVFEDKNDADFFNNRLGFPHRLACIRLEWEEGRFDD
jgi:hypothetical protein